MKKVIYFTAMFMLMLAVLSACSEQSNSSQKQMDLGTQCLAEGNYQEAISAFSANIENAAEKEEDLEVAYARRGQAYLLSDENGRYITEAQADYEKALELAPDNADFVLSLADIYIYQNQYERAVKILQSAQEQNGETQDIANKIAEFQNGTVNDCYNNPHEVDYSIRKLLPPIALADYIGRTLGELKKDFGDNYEITGYSGSMGVTYDNNTIFLFGGTPENFPDSLVIRLIVSVSSEPVVYDLCGNMTYLQLKEHLVGLVELDEPEKFYDLEYEQFDYTLGYQYREYNIAYTWYDDPNVDNSPEIWVYNNNVLSYMTEEDYALDKNAASEVQTVEEKIEPIYDGFTCEPFVGPGWFDGIFGCKFYVPEGFVQLDTSDFARGLGMHSYYFGNEELDMTIFVYESNFETLPVELSDMKDEYETKKSRDSVTYSTSKDNFYVLSGKNDNGNIYYERVDYNEWDYKTVTFNYPEKNKAICDQILIDFLDIYSPISDE